MPERELELNKMYRRLKFVLDMLREANQPLQAPNYQDDAPSTDDINQLVEQNDCDEGDENHG